MTIRLTSPTRSQRGAVSLIIALILLFAGTLIAFFANRGLIFEQRTSANQFRATNAFELAEAGVEWAVGRLNEGLPLAAAPSCAATGAAGALTFQDRYVNASAPTATQPNLWFNVPTDGRYAECRFDPTVAATNGGWTCSCPNVTGVIALGSTEQRRFGVRFNAVAGDVSMVEVIARGCTNGASCDPIDPVPAPVGRDATAAVRVLVKLRPSVSGGPRAALTSGSATNTGGSLNVINQYAPSNGITIHAGTSVETGGGNKLYTLPGTPVSASVLDNDPSLYNLTVADEDAFFAKFFGESLTSYSQAANTIRLSGSATANGDAIRAAVATGARELRFFVDGDLRMSGGPNLPTIGASDNPVIVVVRGDMEMTGNLTAYGIFYSATSTANTPEDPGSGGSAIYGAYITRGAFRKQGNGNFSIVYTPTLWASGRPGGQLIKVPGSWRDF
jgi:Tfp pilus assembly protein PilX